MKTMGTDDPHLALECLVCGETTTRREAGVGHVGACLDRLHDEGDGHRVAKRGGGEAYHARFVGHGVAGRHVLHLEVRGDARFHAVDDVLRELWMACCGHLSFFEVDGRRVYRTEASARQLGGATMETRFSKFAGDGTKLAYEYDFGTTTRAEGEVVSARQRATTESPVRVLAVNLPPETPCGSCGEAPAEHVCAMCYYDRNPLLCEGCAGEHGCEAHALAPLANSPRAGVCGYTRPPEGAPTRQAGGEGP